MATPVQLQSLSTSLGPTPEEICLRIEVRMLRQELLSARTVNHEHEVLIASLFTALKCIQNGVCLNCKATVEKFAPPHFAAVVDAIDPAGPPHFSKNSCNSHFSRRIFKARRRGSLLSPTSESDSVSSHPVQHKLIKSILGVSSVSFKLPNITKSTEKHTQYGWSIKINKKPKPSLNISFESAKIYEGSVACVKFSSTGRYLAAGVNDKSGGWQARIYDMETKEVCPDLSATKSNSHLWSMCFSPNDQYLAIADSAKKILIWEIKKNLVRTILEGHTKQVTSVDFSPDGRFLASSSKDRTARIWSIRDGVPKVLEDDAQPYSQVRFSPSGRYIAAANDDGMLRIWNTRTGRLVTRWRGHDDAVRGVMFRPDGTKLFSGSQDGAVKSWNITHRLEQGVLETQTQSHKDQEILKLKTQMDIGACLNLSPNGQWLVWAPSHDRLPLLITDTASLELQYTLQRREMRVLSTDFSPTGGFLALGSADGQLSFWKYGAT